MAGRNLFEDYRYLGRANTTSPICVFISHNSRDKPMARAVASALAEIGADVYFDEADLVLSTGAQTGNDRAIVAAIEDGLDHCTHLLGLITERTFDSWWVPYEIGGARGRKRECAHLVASGVTALPSYVKVVPLFPDVDDLFKWVRKLLPGRVPLLKEAMASRVGTTLSQFVPLYRAVSDLNFY